MEIIFIVKINKTILKQVKNIFVSYCPQAKEILLLNIKRRLFLIHIKDDLF